MRLEQFRAAVRVAVRVTVRSKADLLAHGTLPLRSWGARESGFHTRQMVRERTEATAQKLSAYAGLGLASAVGLGLTASS